MRRSTALVAIAVVAVSLVPVLATGSSSAARSSATAITLPDLQVLVPTDAISIGTNPSTGHRQLQFTHVTWDAGTGPFAIQPAYDAASGLSSFRQVLYRSAGPARWAAARALPLARDGIFEPPSDYRYPLTRFTLNAVRPDGTIGPIVRVSPKVEYCITADTFVGGVPNAPGQTSPPQSDCASPTKLLGFSVGWGDQYDQTDNGQPIDLTGVPDGTYILRAIVDPQHLFDESNRANDVVDTRLQLSGTQVTVRAQTHPRVVPPAVRVTTPAAGATVVGTVTLEARATAAAPATVSSVQYLLDGEPLGAPRTQAPYRLAWSTGPLPGTHALAAQVIDSNGMVGSAPVEVVHVARSRTAGLAIDAQASADGHGTVRTGAFSTNTAGDTLLALVGLDGPQAVRQSTTVTGAGLRWHLCRRANAQAGDAEIWTAHAASVLRHVRVASTPTAGGFAAQLVVLAMAGALGVGAGATAAGPGGAPSVALTTTGARSDVVLVGSDWDQAIARTPDAGQQLLREWVDAADGDTFWVQAPTGPIASAGSRVTLGDTAPTSDRWDLAAVEVRAAPLPPASVVLADPAPHETLSSATPVAVVVRDPAAVRTVRVLVDGRPIGAATARAGRFVLRWDTRGFPSGSHRITVRAIDAIGRTARASTVVLVANPRPAMTCFVLQADEQVRGDGRLAAPPIRVASPGERLVAIVQSAPGTRLGPVTSEPPVRWHRVRAIADAGGSASVWSAVAPPRLAPLRVATTTTAEGSLTVLAMEGTDGLGADATWHDRSTPGPALLTTRPTSLVLALGVERARPDVADPPVGWVSLDRAAAAGWSTWVQYTDQPIRRAGTRVPIPQVPRDRGPWVVLAIELPGEDG